MSNTTIYTKKHSQVKSCQIKINQKNSPRIFQTKIVIQNVPNIISKSNIPDHTSTNALDPVNKTITTHK